MTAVVPTGAVAAAPTPRRGRGGGAGPDDSGAVRLTPWAGTGLGVAVIWMSLLVLIPLAAVVAKAAGLGVSGFWDAVTSNDAVSAITLTVGASAAVTVVNAVFGTLIAWVLARDTFPGRRVLETVIDIPFALPTIVAGLVMLTLYGEDSPIGLDLAGTRPGVVVALLFVTLPFVVRTVQPVLEVLDREAELAATSLGASGFTVFRRIVLPAILPAVLSGSALAFARALGEYGSVVLIAAGVQKTQVASMFVYNRIQVDKLGDAAAVSTVLLVIAVVVILAMGALQKWVARRG
ncbi:sulfate ABC transporter permease subunit CysT [Jatrophihabitans sp. YIM 134969]